MSFHICLTMDPSHLTIVDTTHLTKIMTRLTKIVTHLMKIVTRMTKFVVTHLMNQEVTKLKTISDAMQK